MRVTAFMRLIVTVGLIYFAVWQGSRIAMTIILVLIALVFELWAVLE